MAYGIIQSFSAFIATAALAVIMRIPRKYIVYAGVIGAIGWDLYLTCVFYQVSVISSSFAAALLVAMCSHICARIFKSPVTVFLIPGILPVVPGLGMYRIAYNIVIAQTDQALFYLIQTLEIAGVIAIAIFIMDTIFRILQRVK